MQVMGPLGNGNRIDYCGGTIPQGEENQPREEPWRNFPIDPETGYAKDPETGAYVDPETGAMLGGSFEGGISPGGLASPAASPEASPQTEPSASPSASPGT